MSFRDDHDAAISRISVLERELDAARENSERDQQRMQMLEREIADLRRLAPPALPRARAPSAPPPVRSPQGPAVSRVALAGWAVFGLLVLWAALAVAR